NASSFPTLRSRHTPTTSQPRSSARCTMYFPSFPEAPTIQTFITRTRSFQSGDVGLSLLQAGFYLGLRPSPEKRPSRKLAFCGNGHSPIGRTSRAYRACDAESRSEHTCPLIDDSFCPEY